MPSGTPSKRNRNLNRSQFPAAGASFEEKEQFNRENDFGLPPEQEAYHRAAAEAQVHKDRMASMGVAERHQYMRGLRETLNDDAPKSGDFDNPLRKDLPREPAPPRQSRKNPLTQARKNRVHITAMARKSRGRRR